MYWTASWQAMTLKYGRFVEKQVMLQCQSLLFRIDEIVNSRERTRKDDDETYGILTR